MALTDYGLLTLATLGLTLVAISIATYLAYQGYRGLRRHDSKPMQYLSVGIVLLFGVTYVVSFTGTIAFRYSLVSLSLQPAFRFLVRLLQVSGLAAVAYSLYLVRTAEPTLHAADGGRDPRAGAPSDGEQATRTATETDDANHEETTE
ncbi:MAG: hypothetical protein ABEJ40_09250 [Haloarculaceae archaeon]